VSFRRVGAHCRTGAPKAHKAHSGPEKSWFVWAARFKKATSLDELV